MKMLDKRTMGDLVKLMIFIVVTTLATGMLAIIIGNLNFQPTHTYKAMFTDVTGLNKGDDIRVAGVKVGTVSGISITNRTEALVTFSVATDAVVNKGTHALIKYRNLVGNRYIALSPAPGDPTRIPDDATLPLSQTQPALDLTVLFNGFKPLFAALSPADLNKLSYEIVQVFQGEGGTLQGLLAHTADITQTLADRDQVISQLIDNLNGVLVHIGQRDKQLGQLIVSFRNLVGGLKNDRNAILGSLDQVSNLSVQTAQLITGIRQPFVNDIHQLRNVATTLDKPANKAELDRALQVLPIKLNKMGRTAAYGSWFNFYLCTFKGNVVLPTGQSLPVNYNAGSSRCNLH